MYLVAAVGHIGNYKGGYMVDGKSSGIYLFYFALIAFSDILKYKSVNIQIF
jgi:hypothetical protein